MQYQSVVSGRFIARPNRFIAQVEVNGTEVTAHVKNTGRCRELLVPGTTVYLEHAPSPSRKTDYSLVAVEKCGLLINMDSQAPNRVTREALEAGWRPPGFDVKTLEIRREAVYGDSRLDFLLQGEGRCLYLEVKGVTLEEDGAVLFPDAPTLRGIRHLQELQRAVGQGLEAGVLFVVQMEQADYFAPNNKTHPAFGEALHLARDNGVGVWAKTCRVTPDSLLLHKDLPVRL